MQRASFEGNGRFIEWKPRIHVSEEENGGRISASFRNTQPFRIRDLLRGCRRFVNPGFCFFRHIVYDGLEITL